MKAVEYGVIVAAGGATDIDGEAARRGVSKRKVDVRKVVAWNRHTDV
jgi:hypothetical protein